MVNNLPRIPVMQGSLDAEKIKYKDIAVVSERLKIIIFIILGLFAIVILRLIFLQIIKGNRYWELANNNSLRIIQKKAPRGNIFDRNGNRLVYNRPYYSVSVIPADMKNRDFVISKLSRLLDLDRDEIELKLDKMNKNAIDAVVIKDNCDSRIASIIEEDRHNLPGVIVLLEPKRMYQYGGLAFHSIGYVNEVTDIELLLSNYDNYYIYSMGDLIGRTGVEKECDRILRGVNGNIRIMVDATGRKFKYLGATEPKKGRDITLTIDMRLQKIVDDSLKDKAGSIIVMNPNSGEILAIASSPSPNLEKFSLGLSKKEWETISNNPKHPLHNKVIAGLYSFGSTFKILTAIAALEKGVIDEHTTFQCNGRFWYSTWDYGCWKKDGHGNVNIYKAISESCDIYFYNVGLKLGIENLDKYAFKFGLGELTGIDISGEKKGLVPTPEWKEKKEGVAWFPGNTVQLSIGQGYILATPLQMLNIFNIIATDGILCMPHIIKNYKEPKKERIELSSKNIEIIKKALVDVVNSDKGTGSRARINGISVAGKTSTIENPQGRTHAGFIAFAPAESPKVSIIVFLEAGGEGGSAAAPIAKNILEAYFKD